MVTGCKCGHGKIVSKTPDENYGQYYVVIECKECNYYWEGYIGYIE